MLSTTAPVTIDDLRALHFSQKNRPRSPAPLGPTGPGKLLRWRCYVPLLAAYPALKQRWFRRRTTKGSAAVSLSCKQHASCVVKIRNEKLEIQEEELAKIDAAFKSSGFQRIIVISIAGALRQGKSFLMDLFAKFLDEKKMPRKRNAEHQRFYWNSGIDRVTEGIWVCPQVFSGPAGVGIVLMDTQGTFEPGASRWHNNVLLGLATALSSTMIFNVSKQLQEERMVKKQLFFLGTWKANSFYLRVKLYLFPNNSTYQLQQKHKKTALPWARHWAFQVAMFLAGKKPRQVELVLYKLEPAWRIIPFAI